MTVRPFFYSMVLLLLAGVLLVGCADTGHTATATPTAQATPQYQTSIKTTDGVLLLTLHITPDRLGKNQFYLDVKNVSTGKPVDDEEVQIFTSMLDMDMGTGVIMFSSAGNGRYNAQADLPMDGNWQLNLQLLDGAIHIARLKIYLPA